MQPHSKEALQTIKHSVSKALEEDIGPDFLTGDRNGDVTAAAYNFEHVADAKVICREQAILCGQEWFAESFKQITPAIEITWLLQDGKAIEENDTVCTLKGPAQAILTGERTALNFLQTLSATATQTNTYVEHISGTGAKILDTRKTIPGLRYAQKYAVTCGGGNNHRMGLYDAILIKENHIVTAGSVSKAVTLAKDKFPNLKLEVEVETHEQLEEAVQSSADIILLDNFSLSELETAVTTNDGKKKLEASGNINLDNIREIAKTGVDFISIGAITKHIRAIDYSMRFE